MSAATLATATPVNPDATAAIADFAAMKTWQQSGWSSGNYAVVGTTLQIVGEELCEALDLRAGRKVLDVAAGNGMASLAAARRWCEVTSTDYVPEALHVEQRLPDHPVRPRSPCSQGDLGLFEHPLAARIRARFSIGLGRQCGRAGRGWGDLRDDRSVCQHHRSEVAREEVATTSPISLPSSSSGSFLAALQLSSFEHQR